MKRIVGLVLLIAVATALTGAWRFGGAQADGSGNVGITPPSKRAAHNANDFQIELQVQNLTTAASCYADPTVIASGSGAPVSYAGSTLTDTSKNFAVNALAGKPVTVFGQFLNSGQQVTYTATTATDASAAWTPGALVGLTVVSENILGGRLNPTTLISSVSYTSTSFTDVSHSLGVNTLNGLTVVAGSSIGTVASNTATTVTLSAAWTGGTPPADTLYAVLTPQKSAVIAANTATQITIAGAWTPPNPIKDTRLTIDVPAAKVSGSGGTVTYGASSLTDTSKSFVTNQLAGSSVVGISPSVTGSGGTVTYASHTGSGATVTYGASTLTDTSKSYGVNALAGKTVVVGVVQGVVASNTATVITLTAPWTNQPINGNQYIIAWLTDTSKSFTTNSHAGKLVRSGSNEASVISNTATTLNFATVWSPATPSAGAAYEITPTTYSAVIASNTGTVVTLSGNWSPVAPVAGTPYFIKVPSVSRTIASNTATVMTMTAAWTPAIPNAGSLYQVANSQPTSVCGLGSYNTVINFDPAKLGYVSAMNTAYLGSTGRTLNPNPCTPTVTTGQIVLNCSTLGGVPLGPTGTGTLATLKFDPLSFVNDTTVITQDTIITDIEAGLITHTENNGTILFSRCADMSGNNAVTLGDALSALPFVGLTVNNDPAWATHAKYDINSNNAITLADLLYIVDEVGQLCVFIP